MEAGWAEVTRNDLPLAVIGSEIAGSADDSLVISVSQFLVIWFFRCTKSIDSGPR